MKRFRFTLTGLTPLLLHADNVEWADRMDEWKSAAKISGTKSKAGDDRTPAWRWIGCVYNDGTRVTIPCMNLTACLSEAGKSFTDETRGKRATMKRSAVTGLTFERADFALAGSAGEVKMADILALLDVESFAEHKAAAERLGFALDVRRLRVQSSKHVRVRPRFDVWSISGTVGVRHDQLEDAAELTRLFNHAGSQIGLCDGRPGSPAPGPYGRFTTELEAIR